MKNFLKQSLWISGPIFIVFWLYKGVLRANFNLEDAMLLGDAAKALTKGNWRYTFVPWWGAYARFFWQPVAVVFYKFFGYNATPFFALSLFFHLMNVFLVYLLAIKLTNSKLIALFSSLLYGIYQVNFEGPTWILSGIKDMPMTTFFLLSFIFYLNFIKEKKPKQLFFSCLAFCLALFCELKAILIPVVFLSYDLLIKEKFNLKKLFSKNLLKYFPYLLIGFVFFFKVYPKTLGMFSGAKNEKFLLSFPASLPFYFFPINRLFWLSLKLTKAPMTEAFLIKFGSVIALFWLALIFLFFLKKEEGKLLTISFLFLGVFLNYLPVILTVLSGYHSLWQTVAIHWRYYTLASSLASILVVSSLVWAASLVSRKTFFLPLLFLSIVIVWSFNYDRFMLSEFLNWSVLARNNFQIIKKTYQSFPEESVLVIEGVEDEKKFLFYESRYLFENIFALYANPNNPAYLEKQQKLFLNPEEGPYRSLSRLLYYTNLKDFLVGNHEHIFSFNLNDHWIVLNLPWRLPAYDRLFLGAIYGFYQPEKVFVFKFLENGAVVNETESRRNQLSYFLSLFCFKNGLKSCERSFKPSLQNQSFWEIYSLFSNEGKKIIDFLISRPKGPLPVLGEIKV